MEFHLNYILYKSNAISSCDGDFKLEIHQSSVAVFISFPRFLVSFARGFKFSTGFVFSHTSFGKKKTNSKRKYAM